MRHNVQNHSIGRVREVSGTAGVVLIHVVKEKKIEIEMQSKPKKGT
jgi:hypothetical protein